MAERQNRKQRRARVDLNLLSDLKGRVGRMKLKNAVTLEANGKLYIALDLCTLGRGLPPEPTESVRIPEAYHVIADCVDEDGQRRAYELLRNAGFKCRVLTL